MDNEIGYHSVVLRYRHNLGLDEFVNIGILIFDLGRKDITYKVCKYSVRAQQFFKMNPDHLVEVLRVLDHRLGIAQEDQARFHQFDSIDNVLNQVIGDPNDCFTYSNIMGGLSGNLTKTLTSAMDQYVYKYSQNVP